MNFKLDNSKVNKTIIEIEIDSEDIIKAKLTKQDWDYIYKKFKDTDTLAKLEMCMFIARRISLK